MTIGCGPAPLQRARRPGRLPRSLWLLAFLLLPAACGGTGPTDEDGTGSPGTLAWRFQTSSAIQAAPAVGNGGTIYVTSFLYLYAIDPDGSQQWRVNIGSAGLAAPTVGDDGTIYAGTEGNQLYAIGSGGSNASSGALAHVRLI